MQDLNVTVVQQDLAWQQPAANLAHFSSLLQQQQGADLVVLPEMFTTGFTMKPEVCAESMEGAAISWMRMTSQRLGAAVGGSLAIEEDGGFCNRFVFVKPDASIETYDKRHLFRLAAEHQHYRSGNTRCVVPWRGWRLCLQVCYDLRFPVWSRHRGDYDALLYVANWPSKRRLHWRTLLQARALENQAYVIGVNRIGRDGNNLEYAGDSLVIDPWGAIVFDAESRPCCATVSLSAQTLRGCREKFPVHLDADQFELR